MLENEAIKLMFDWRDLRDGVSNYIKSAFDFEDLLEVDRDQLVLLKKSYDYMDSLLSYEILRAKAIDDINKKLDKLLEKSEEEGS